MENLFHGSSSQIPVMINQQGGLVSQKCCDRPSGLPWLVELSDFHMMQKLPSGFLGSLQLGTWMTNIGPGSSLAHITNCSS